MAKHSNKVGKSRSKSISSTVTELDDALAFLGKIWKADKKNRVKMLIIENNSIKVMLKKNHTSYVHYKV